jgi:hypothetical protein
MTKPCKIDPEVRSKLVSLHEEIMWLAARPNITPSMARAWYTHVVAGKFKRHIRLFSGKVSQTAISDLDAVLRLEHHARIQTTLTNLVTAHLKRKRPSAHEFVRKVVECENVHIVTFAENYAAMSNNGNYRRAGIKLVAWRSIPIERRQALWQKMLRGKVANAAEFKPAL